MSSYALNFDRKVMQQIHPMKSDYISEKMHYSRRFSGEQQNVGDISTLAFTPREVSGGESTSPVEFRQQMFNQTASYPFPEQEIDPRFAAMHSTDFTGNLLTSESGLNPRKRNREATDDSLFNMLVASASGAPNSLMNDGRFMGQNSGMPLPETTRQDSLQLFGTGGSFDIPANERNDSLVVSFPHASTLSAVVGDGAVENFNIQPPASSGRDAFFYPNTLVQSSTQPTTSDHSSAPLMYNPYRLNSSNSVSQPLQATHVLRTLQSFGDGFHSPSPISVQSSAPSSTNVRVSTEIESDRKDDNEDAISHRGHSIDLHQQNTNDNAFMMKAKRQSAARAAKSLRKLNSGNLDTQYSPSDVNDDDDDDDGDVSRGSGKKKKKTKHQLTDRSRRARIKAGMEILKNIVIQDTASKPDQATIVASSVSMLQSLQNEVQQLKDKVAELKIKELEHSNVNDNFAKSQQLLAKTSLSPTLPSPLSAMMFSLGSLGVLIKRLSLHCRLQEVNNVFMQLTGFSNEAVLGRIPCDAPLFSQLLLVPSSVMDLFVSSRNFAGQVRFDDDKINTSQISDMLLESTVSHSADTHPPSDASSSLQSESKILSSSELVSEIGTRRLQHMRQPSFADLPVLKTSEFESFFSVVPTDFPHDHNIQSVRPSSSNECIGATQFYNFMVKHLVATSQPMTLMSRYRTAYGQVVEELMSLSLVKDVDNKPLHIIAISTPDCRRLIPSLYG